MSNLLYLKRKKDFDLINQAMWNIEGKLGFRSVTPELLEEEIERIQPVKTAEEKIILLNPTLPVIIQALKHDS